MRVKTEYLTGPALDWLVALAEGHKPPLLRILRGNVALPDLDDPMNCDYLSYSSDWSQGGPIIDREHINIRHTITEGGYRTAQSNDAVEARIDLPNGAKLFDPAKLVFDYGPTALVAAMRCYVRSKLGDEVDIPEEIGS